MTNLEYDKLVGRDSNYSYCDICDTRLGTSMEREHGRYNDCCDKEYERKLIENYNIQKQWKRKLK
jgi:hypothetical protein